MSRSQPLARVGFIATLTIAAVALLAVTAAPAAAQTTRTWNVTNGTWGTTTSWVGGTAASATDPAFFSGAGAGTNAVTVRLGADTSVLGMTFSTGTTTLRSDSATARTLTLGTSGITVNSTAGGATIGVGGSAVNLLLSGSQTWTNSTSGTVSVVGNVNSVSTPVLLTLGGTSTSGTNSAISGTISGAAGREISISKVGTGDWTLAGNNTYDGSTSVTAGRLAVSSASGLGSTVGATVVSSGAQVQFQASSQTISVAENFTISGTGRGATNQTNGALSIWSNSATQTFSGTITLDNGATMADYGAGTRNVTVSNGIAGTGDLTIRSFSNGPGGSVWTLNGQSSYAGNTTFATDRVASMIVQNGTNNALPAATVLTLNATNPSGANAAGTVLNYRLGGFSQTLAGLAGGTPGGSGTTAFANVVTGGTTTLSTLTLNVASGTSTYAGGIGGAGTNDNNLAVVKAGAGTQVFSGSNTYTGTTTISGGILQLSSANALAGGGNVTFSGGTLRYSAGNQADLASQIVNSGSAINISTNSQTITWATSIDSSNTGGLIRSGTIGSLILSASNAFSGPVVVNADATQIDATLVVNHPFALGQSTSGTVSRGAMVIGSGITAGSGMTLAVGSAGGANAGSGSRLSGGLTVQSGTGTWAGNYVTSGQGRMGYDGGNLVITGTVSGTAPWISGYGDTNINSGPNSVTIAAQATYTGTTNIVRGRLKIGVDDALPSSTTLDVFNSALANSPQAGTFDLNGFNQTVAGLVSSGQANVLSGTAGYANAYVTNSAGGAAKTFTVNQAASGTYAGLITGNLAFTKAGAGNLTLVPVFITTSGSNTFVSGTNTFTGDTRVNGGTLTLSTAVGTTSLALAGSTFDSDGEGTLSFGSMTAATFGGLKGAGGLALQNGSSAAVALTVGANNASTTYAGALSGAGSLVKVGSGTTTLSGVNTYAGTTAVNVGKLLVSGQLGTGAVSVASGATLGGSGVIGGAVTVDGLLSPGNSPGDLSVASLVLNASSTVLMEIDGTTAGTQYDQVSILSGGSIAYDGALQLNLSQTFSDNTTFNLFEGFGSSFSGNFATITSVGSAYNGLTFTRVNNLWTSTAAGSQTVEFNQATGQLVIVPEPGALALAGLGIAAAAWIRGRRK